MPRIRSKRTHGEVSLSIALSEKSSFYTKSYTTKNKTSFSSRKVNLKKPPSIEIYMDRKMNQESDHSLSSF